MADITYPTATKTDYEKLGAVYSLIEQMRLEHNRQGAKARSNREKYSGKIITYAGISKNLLKPLLAERNILKSRILEATYTDEQRRKLTLEELAAAQSQMFGDREALKALPTEATSRYLDELKAIDLDKLGDTAPIDPTEAFTSSDWNNGTPQSDPNNRLTITSSKVEFDNLTRNEDCYFYRDMGVNHFDGDFTHRIETLLDAYSSSHASFVWGLTNDIDDYYGLRMNGNPSLGSLWYWDNQFWVYEVFGVDDINFDTIYLYPDTLYYVEIVRDESLGTYGALYAQICDDDYYSNGGNLIDTIGIWLQVAKRDFRYIFAINSYNTGTTPYGTGYMQNLDIQEVSETEKTSSDRSAGVDAVVTGSPAAMATGMDTGQGIEAKVDYPDGTITGVESGSGDDAASIVEQVIYPNDSGSGVDTVVAGSPSIMAVGTDTGQGTEAKADYPGGEFAGIESGSGDDTASIVERAIYASDSGSGIESSFLETEDIVNQYGEEIGSGEEAVSQREITSSETGAGVDIAETTVTRIVSESGSGVDIAETTVAWIATDSGSGIDIAETAVVRIVSDSGSGIGIAQTIVIWTGSDSGSGIEESVVSPVFFADDTGLGLEFGVLIKDAYSSDAFEGEDALKALVCTGGKSQDMRLHGRTGKTGIPSRKTGITSKGVNI